MAVFVGFTACDDIAQWARYIAQADEIRTSTTKSERLSDV
jgi:hypothetical protein